MRQFRRVGGAAFAGLLLTAVISGPSASAQTAPTYAASAAGRVLNLRIGAEGFTAGASSATIDSTKKATAQGTGYLSPLASQQTAKLEQVGDGAQDAPQACSADLTALPAPLSDIIGLGAGCSSALVQVQNGLPRGSASGSVAGLGLDATPVLDQVPVEDVLGAVLSPILGGIGQVEDALSGAICPSVEGGCVNVGDTVDDIVTAVTEQPIIDVELGTSTSETVDTGTQIISTATSAGGTIALFPIGGELLTGAGVEVAPIIEIVIGSAKATVTYDKQSGTSTPSFDPAIVTLNINAPLVQGLADLTGQTLSSIVIGPGLVPDQLNAIPGAAQAAALLTACPDAPNEFCLLAGTPLETRIATASGRTVTNADGSIMAIADAVKVNALRNIADVGVPLPGGILLELAHAEAGLGATAPAPPAETPQAPPLEPETARELPRTGGPALLPLLAVAGLGGALGVRRMVAKASR